jgi:hypothetical protein
VALFEIVPLAMPIEKPVFPFPKIEFGLNELGSIASILGMFLGGRAYYHYVIDRDRNPGAAQRDLLVAQGG